MDHNPETCAQNMQACNFSEREEAAIDEEKAKLLNRKVINPCTMEDGQMVSPICVRQKSDGAFRVMLN